MNEIDRIRLTYSLIALFGVLLALLVGCVTPSITIPPITIPTTTTTTQPQTSCGCDLSLPLCDPSSVTYSQGYMDNPDNARFEECGIEAQAKIICRFCVIRGNSGGYWMLSSVGIDHVSRDANNNGTCKCFTEGNYRYHVKGYCADEPVQSQILTTPLTTHGKYIVVECRKIQ